MSSQEYLAQSSIDESVSLGNREGAQYVSLPSLPLLPNSSQGETHAPSNDLPDGPRRGYADVSDEAEASPWARKTVLTFDGGGIRGYSSLLILKHLMSKIREKEQELSNGQVQSSSDYPWMEKAGPTSKCTDADDPLNEFLPCHYFDYMAGTSTGGLSAIMLGRLRMSVDEALSHYNGFGNAVFGKSRWWHERSILWLPRAKFPTRNVRAAIVKVIHTKLKQNNPDFTEYQARTEPFKSREDQTRTMVLSFCKNPKEGLDFIHVWRTYDHEQGIVQDKNQYRPMNPSPAHRDPMWRVALATSAAPIYFESVKIGDRKFFDGGIGANNPAFLAIQEIKHMHLHPPALFVSIGTGKKTNPSQETENNERDRDWEFFASDRTNEASRKQFLKKYLELGRLWKDFITDTEGIAGVNSWHNFCELYNTPRRRFNVDHNLGSMPLDDWRPSNSGQVTLEEIRGHTGQYLNLEEVQEHLDFCAEQLVLIRRRRAETERWESFATDIEYQCPCQSCQANIACHYKERDKLRQHFAYSHDDLLSHSGDLETFVDAGRVMTGPRSKHFDATVDKLRRATTKQYSNGTIGSSSRTRNRQPNGSLPNH